MVFDLRERSRDAAQGRDDQATPYQTAIGAKAALLTPAAPTALDPERALEIGYVTGGKCEDTDFDFRSARFCLDQCLKCGKADRLQTF